ncbi:Ig-like domain-containing protein [Thaumasiovibrio subtropicus]|uniref:Ig-like domain-containing protein n=1 Tax=Thaumasiovibrio subtropicus TaxID=1891207 RepID=UPI000B35A429|nr:Ig-like domain-containing protein [Thaumasiovibrio subtropicus]
MRSLTPTGKINKITGALFAAGLLISPMAALALNVDIDVNPQTEGQYWSTYQIAIQNADDQAIDMRDATVTFVLDHHVSDINWSSATLSYPNWRIEHSTTNDGILHTITFLFPDGDWANTLLQTADHFTLSISMSGMINDLDAFSQSIAFNGEGGTLPPQGDITLTSPQSGARLAVNEETTIVADAHGEDAYRVEFWAANEKLGDQIIDVDTENYHQPWTPSALGASQVEVILFSEEGKRIKAASANVDIYNDNPDFQPPAINFITPAEGDEFKQTDSVRIEINATDADDDLAHVAVSANNQTICEFDASEVTNFECDWQPDVIGSVELIATATDEQALTSTANVNIRVTQSSGGQCGDIPQYEDGMHYQVGDRVSNIGHLFSCTVAGWCGNPVWTPGTGHPNYPDAWKDAWHEEGECDLTPVPEIDLVAPGQGERFRLNEQIPVIVAAEDSEGTVTRVEVLLNGQHIANADTPTSGNQYHFTLPPQQEGMYELSAVAHNDLGGENQTQAISIAVTDIDLVVSLTSPADGSSYYQGRAIRMAAEANTFDGVITGVEFIANGERLTEVTQPPYEYQWNGAQLGEHTITAIAHNSEGDSQTSVPASIEVKEPQDDHDLRDNPDRTITYLTSWGLRDIEQLLDSQGDAYFLSFGKWDASGNIAVSDDMITPKYDPSWMAPQYLAWTHLKHAHPRKAMMIAMGGATYDSMWNHMGTPAQREAIVDGLVDLLNTPYPVYKKNLSPDELVGECQAFDWQGNCDFSAYQLAGYATIDGVDFDFERTTRITEEDNRNLEALVTLLRERIGESKLLSLTTYHVGADPVECANPAVFDDCSFIEPDRSAHHGEVISLLENTRDTFDFFNVMAYDAGENFRYEVAMANYAKYVGDKEKVVLGNTINSQWGPNGRFVETRENNIKRTQWQKQNGYGGFFIWTLGSNTEGLTMKEQVAYFNELDDNN